MDNSGARSLPGLEYQEDLLVCGLNVLLLQALCVKNALKHTIFKRKKNSKISCGGAFWEGLT